MTDIPDHLIEALCPADQSSLYGPGLTRAHARAKITAVLAALRPEDAHLVPAWRVAQHNQLADLLVERDKARAEVERLKTDTVDWPATLEGILRERDEARAENMRLTSQRDDFAARIDTLCDGFEVLLAENKRLRHALNEATVAYLQDRGQYD